MTEPTLLIVAKAPIPGLCKTRIAEAIGELDAAQLAAAALLDTLDTANASGYPVVVAMSGVLDEAVDGDRIRAALEDVRVVRQRGDTFAERLAQAHRDADDGYGVVQVGMDTPQLSVDDYREAAQWVRAGEVALGPAEDGGWWLLGVPEAARADVLMSVPMSTPRTAACTAEALGKVHWLRTLRDMDTWSDTVTLAQQLPTSRLALVAERISGVVHD